MLKPILMASAFVLGLAMLPAASQAAPMMMSHRHHYMHHYRHYTMHHYRRTLAPRMTSPASNIPAH